MQLISVRELIYLLKKAGWQKMAQKGSHAQYRHPVRKGKMTFNAAAEAIKELDRAMKIDENILRHRIIRK